MKKVTIQAVANPTDIKDSYMAYEWKEDGDIHFVFERVQSVFPNKDIIRAWVIPPEFAKDWVQYSAKAKGDILTLTKK